MKSSNYLRQAKRRHQRKPEGNHSELDHKNQWQDKVIGKYQLSLLLDINRAQLDAWIKEGMPVLRQGGINKEWEFDLVAIKAWVHAQGYEIDERI